MHRQYCLTQLLQHYSVLPNILVLKANLIMMFGVQFFSSMFFYFMSYSHPLLFIIPNLSVSSMFFLPSPSFLSPLLLIILHTLPASTVTQTLCSLKNDSDFQVGNYILLVNILQCAFFFFLIQVLQICESCLKVQHGITSTLEVCGKKQNNS